MATRVELGQRGSIRARTVLSELDIRTIQEIEIEAIAAHFNLLVRDGGLEGAQGRLVRGRRRGIIRIMSGLTQMERRRYIIAHELGHHLLHNNQAAFCAERDLLRYQPGNAETEANSFAAELLMPRKLLEPLCDVARPSFEDVRRLSKTFGTTLTATAIRFVDLCPEACAIVWSENTRVKWAIAGPDFPYIAFGKPLSSYSLASDAFRGANLPDGPEEVPAHAWIERSGDIVEHSIQIPSLKAVLTLLWRPSD